MEKIRLLFLYLYLFSLSIENWSPWGDKTSLFRPALIFGILYVMLSLTNIRVNFKIGKSKKMLIPTFWVWFWISFISLVFASFNNAIYVFNYSFLACILSFWLLSNDLRRYRNLKHHFLYIILINGVFLSFLSFFQIGIDLGHMDRQSLLGNNSNIIGLASSISFLIIIYLLIENPKKWNKLRYLLILFVPFLLQTIAKTGSKGAMITLGVSLITYFIVLNKPFKQKIPLIILSLVGLIYGAFYMLQNQVLATRMESFLKTGDTTGRAERWELAFDVFLDNPIFGVGENGLNYLVSENFRSYDPHNVFLYVMATGGLVASIPFFIFLYTVFKNGYTYKPVWGTNLHLVLFLIMLMFWFKAGGGLNSKLAWAYFAFIAHQPYNYLNYANSNTRD